MTDQEIRKLKGNGQENEIIIKEKNKTKGIRYILNIPCVEITFDTINKEITIYNSWSNSIRFSVHLHQAITQQMKELGWI